MVTLYKIGADVEFGLQRKDTPIPANSLFSFGNPLSAYIGTDTVGHTGEIRPRAFKTVLPVVYDVGMAIMKMHTFLQTRFPDYNIVTGPSNRGWPMGGHIHLSYFDKTEFGRDKWYNVSCLIIPFYKWIYGEKLVDDRANRGYGGMYDTRRQDEYSLRHSLPKRFRKQALQLNWTEYRTPPSWLTSPQIAWLSLALVKNSASKCLSNSWPPLPNITSFPIYHHYKRFKECWDVFLDAEGGDYNECLAISNTINILYDKIGEGGLGAGAPDVDVEAWRRWLQ